MKKTLPKPIDSLEDAVDRLAELKRRREERMKNAPPLEYVTPEPFLDKDSFSSYTFPLKPIVIPDYGRVGVGLEPLYKDGRIDMLFLRIIQRPDDERYASKVYVFPCRHENLATYSHKISFFAGVALIEACPEHGGGNFLSYPPDNASVLRLETSGSIGAMVWYE